jgi:hypothetical protein
MRRELPADYKRDTERKQRLMRRAVLALQSAARELGRCDGMTGLPAADQQLSLAETHIRHALDILG